MPDKPTTTQAMRPTPGYLFATGIRIALSLLVLTFTLKELHDAPNPRFILISVVGYLAYSIFILFDSWRRGGAPEYFKKYSIWIDGIFCSGLTAASGGFSSPYNFLFFFAIIDAATSQRFRRSLFSSAALTLSLGIISVVTLKPPTTVFGIVTSLPVLFLLGVIIAFRSEAGRNLRNRLSLLQQITAVASPTIGLERSIGVTLNLLRSHFEAKDCILVLGHEDTGEFSFFKAHTETSSDSASDDETPDDGFLRRLLSLLPYHAVIYDDARRFFRGAKVVTVCAKSFEKVESRAEEEACAILSEVLDAPRFLSVPVKTSRSYSGRLYLLSSTGASRFHESDLHLVNQVVHILAPLIENARLIDRISSNAAEEERKRIARDIHDSIIQPYLGIRLGLESIRALVKEGENVAAAQAVILDRLDNLNALTDATVENLRDLIHGLADSTASGNTLLPSVKRFADKFAGATGIAVHVIANGDMRFADKLAPDIFQLAVEGLSNVRKHTTSPKAVIELNASETLLNLRISNERTDDDVFRPRSLSERVSALSGTLSVMKDDGTCTVDISIPV